MDTETRAAFATLGEMMQAGFARVDARIDTVVGDVNAGSARTDAGFARIDRFIELQQAQHVELRGEFAELRGEFAELRGEFAELRVEVRGLRDRVDVLTDRVSRLENEVVLLRDFVTREVAEIRLELRRVQGRAEQSDELRREIAELTVRVDQLERREPD